MKANLNEVEEALGGGFHDLEWARDVTSSDWKATVRNLEKVLQLGDAEES